MKSVLKQPAIYTCTWEIQSSCLRIDKRGRPNNIWSGFLIEEDIHHTWNSSANPNSSVWSTGNTETALSLNPTLIPDIILETWSSHLENSCPWGSSGRKASGSPRSTLTPRCWKCEAWFSPLRETGSAKTSQGSFFFFCVKSQCVCVSVILTYEGLFRDDILRHLKEVRTQIWSVTVNFNA